jgi:nitronate monooxygenase
MNLETSICEMLNIKYPIIQAGMAGGPAGTELVIAVSNAGGLGTLGAAYMTAEQIRESIREIKQETDQTFGVNLFCTEMIDITSDVEASQSILNKFRSQLQLPARTGLENPSPNLFEEQFQVLIEEKVPVISTAFGVLPPNKMEAAKKNKSIVTTMITTVEEALIAERAGADIVVAQGSDAGGHRGTFDVSTKPNGANIGTFSLIPQVADAVSVPVIAAGGVMDGRGLAAALTLGAQGVQLGTVFLPSKESAAHEVYKEALLNSTEESTVITKVFSGRPARGIYNTFIREFDKTGKQPAAFPTQNTLTNDIRKEAARQNNSEYMSLWAGQGTRLLNSGLTASEIIDKMVKQAASLF